MDNKWIRLQNKGTMEEDIKAMSRKISSVRIGELLTEYRETELDDISIDGYAEGTINAWLKGEEGPPKWISFQYSVVANVERSRLIKEVV